MEAIYTVPEWRHLPDASTSGLPMLRALLQDRTLAKLGPQGYYFRWGDRLVFHSVALRVPKFGMVEYEIESGLGDNAVGFDLEPEKGLIVLADGSELRALRVWDDRRYEERGRYPFKSKGPLRVWSVFRTPLPNGELREEKWAENAGLLVEPVGSDAVRLRMSPGFAEQPDFERLCVVVRVREG